MTDRHARSVLAVQAKRLATVQHVMEITQQDERSVRELLSQSQWRVAKAMDKFARREFEGSAYEEDMAGSYAQRHEQAIMFMMDALRCNRAMAVKLLRGSGVSVERSISRVISRHRSLVKRRAKYAAESIETVAAGTAGIDNATEPTTEEPMDSEATLTCEGGDTSEDFATRADIEEAIRAEVAVEENEIECFARVFEIGRAEAQGYYFEGQSFRNAVNARVAEYCAEAIEYIDTRNVRRLHKMKQLVMKQAANWTAIRKEHFPCVQGKVEMQIQ